MTVTITVEYDKLGKYLQKKILGIAIPKFQRTTVDMVAELTAVYMAEQLEPHKQTKTYPPDSGHLTDSFYFAKRYGRNYGASVLSSLPRGATIARSVDLGRKGYEVKAPKYIPITNRGVLVGRARSVGPAAPRPFVKKAWEQAWQETADQMHTEFEDCIEQAGGL